MKINLKIQKMDSQAKFKYKYFFWKGVFPVFVGANSRNLIMCLDLALKFYRISMQRIIFD